MERAVTTVTNIWWALAHVSFVGVLLFGVLHPGASKHSPVEMQVTLAWFAVVLTPAIALALWVSRFEEK